MANGNYPSSFKRTARNVYTSGGIMLLLALLVVAVNAFVVVSAILVFSLANIIVNGLMLLVGVFMGYLYFLGKKESKKSTQERN